MKYKLLVINIVEGGNSRIRFVVVSFRHDRGLEGTIHVWCFRLNLYNRIIIYDFTQLFEFPITIFVFFRSDAMVIGTSVENSSTTSFRYSKLLVIE